MICRPCLAPALTLLVAGSRCLYEWLLAFVAPVRVVKAGIAGPRPLTAASCGAGSSGHEHVRCSMRLLLCRITGLLLWLWHYSLCQCLSHHLLVCWVDVLWEVE